MNTLTEVVAILGFVLSIVALAGIGYVLTQERTIDETRAKLRSLDLEVADLGDRLSHWQRRAAVRERRDRGSGEPGVVGSDGIPSPDAANDPAARKRAIRARLAQLKLPGV